MTSSEGRTDLYRFFDSRHHLLYVGISASAAARYAQHRSDKPWADEIATMSVESFATRHEAAMAEAKAIREELPRYNIVHRPRQQPLAVVKPPPVPTVERWIFASRRSGHERTCSLQLGYEVNGSSLTDDYEFADIDAADLFREWRRRHGDDQWASVYWYVRSQDGGVFEAAPYQQEWPENFLWHYTWPRNERTGELLNWLSLPVVDGQWNAKLATKGGFFQQHTGWKPNLLQPRFHIDTVLMAAGLRGDDAIGWRRWPDDPGPDPRLTELSNARMERTFAIDTLGQSWYTR
jgi:hypothetical protein